MHSRARSKAIACALLAMALRPVLAGGQSLTVGTPQVHVTQKIGGSGLPPNREYVVLVLGGVSVGIGISIGWNGTFGPRPFDVTAAPPAVPRTVELRIGSDTFSGTETEGAYPRTVGLSPYGSLTLEAPPVSGYRVEILGTGAPGWCDYDLSVVVGGFFSDRLLLGSGMTGGNGGFGGTFPFPDDGSSVTDFLWEGRPPYGSCAGTALSGRSPGVYPATVPLSTFDPTSVEPSMTIHQPAPFRDQAVRGSALPTHESFDLLLGGTEIDRFDTDDFGSFASSFDVTGAPPALPRAVVLRFGLGPNYRDFGGTEQAGDYPHLVSLVPSGSLLIEAPREILKALAAGAGFPACDTSQLSAETGEGHLPLASFGVTATGLWSFGRWDWPVSSLYGLGLNFPPEAQDASSYLWQGVGTCAGTSLEGVNPGGAYPRHVRMSPPGGHVLFVDPAGGCGGRTPCFIAIQAAIDDAAPGDVVLAGPGRYVENVRFHGKPILVGAEEGPLVTAIDGHGAGSAVTFADGENLSSVLVGFTVANGLTDQEGGGVRVEGASPQILANLIARNGYCNGGGGIGVGFGSPLVVWNWILQNGPIGCTGGIGGGGISVRGASRPAIIANVIYANAAPVGGGISLSGAGNPVIFDNVIGANAASSEGGGISLGLTSDADIVQNLIAYNSAPRGGGIAALVPFGARGPLLASNTIADNDGPQGSGVFIDGFDDRTTLLNNVIVGAAGQPAVYCGDASPSTPVFRYNDAFRPGGPAYGGDCTDQAGRNGNITLDPRFVDPARWDYGLIAGSPALDVGSNTTPWPPPMGLPYPPPADLAGKERNVGMGLDMGAYERQLDGAVVGVASVSARSPADTARWLDQARAAYARFLRVKEGARARDSGR